MANLKKKNPSQQISRKILGAAPWGTFKRQLPWGAFQTIALKFLENFLRKNYTPS